MPVTIFDEEGTLHDPDDLKMPESPGHRRAVDAIGLAASSLLGADFDVFRDMNWYPADGGTAIAPDLMVLPAGAFAASADAVPGARVKSYRQDKTGGPPPAAVVEVPSDTDTHASLMAKAHRCRQLGSVVYIVLIDPPFTVERLEPGAGQQRSWVGTPIPELGHLRLEFDGDRLVVVTPDGVRAGSDDELYEDARQQAAEANRRLAELERRMREAGISPD